MVKIITKFISQWLKEIVLLFIIISIVDIIMPKGKMKRYVDFIIGLLIIFTIISPFTKLNNITLNLDKEVSNFNEKLITKDSLIDIQEKQIENIYVSNLKGQLREVIEDNSAYIVEDIDIATIPDEKNIFNIEEINIVLQSQNDNKDSSIKVSKIEVGEEVAEVVNTEIDSEIIGLITSLGGIDPNKIKLTIIDKGDKYGGNN